MHTLQVFFNWPNGSVWGNLIAAALVWSLGFWRLVKLHKKHQKQLSNQISQEFRNMKKEGE